MKSKRKGEKGSILLSGCHMRLFLSLLAAFLGFTIVFNPMDYAYQLRYVGCIDRLNGGIIYSQGDVDCSQPPGVYLVGSVLSLFGRSNLQLLSYYLIILLHAGTLYTLLTITKPRDWRYAALLVLAYVSLLIPLTSYSTLGPDMACILSLFFVSVGLYFLLARDNNLVSGVFVAFALVAKITAVAVLLGLFVYCLLRELRYTNPRKVKKRRPHQIAVLLKKPLSFLAPSVAIVVLSLIMYPRILVYTSLAQSYGRVHLFESIGEIILTNPIQEVNLGVFYFTILGVWLYYRRYGNDLAVVYILSTISSFLMLYQNNGIIDVFNTYYLFGQNIILLIITFDFIQKVNTGVIGHRLGISVVIFLLFFGGFSVNGTFNLRHLTSLLYAGYGPLSVIDNRHKLIDVEEQTHRVFSQIPKNDGKVVADESMCRVLRKYAPQMNMSLIDCESVSQDMDLDMGYVPGLIHYGVMASAKYPLSDKEAQVARGIENGEYEMVLLGADGAASHLARVWDNVSVKVKSQFCAVALPDINHIKAVNHITSLFISNPIKCQDLMIKSRSYQESLFDDVCMKDQWVANLVKKTYSLSLLNASDRSSGIKEVMEKTCRSNADLIDHIDNSKKTDFRLLALVVFTVAGCILLRKPARGSRR